MKDNILFQFSSGDGLARCLGGELVLPPCNLCKTLRREFIYRDLELHFQTPVCPKKTRQWPMIGGRYHTVVQAEMADALISAGITGFRLHSPTRVSKESGDYSFMPEIPKCYILEPTGMIDFVIPDTEYHPPCPECGHLKPKRFGSPKAPFRFLKDTWDGSNIVRIRNHWQHIMFFDRKVIDVFRGNGWHHQIEYGENCKPYESISFGSAASPGITVRNIDSDTWFEDTVVALKEKYHDYPYK